MFFFEMSDSEGCVMEFLLQIEEFLNYDKKAFTL